MNKINHPGPLPEKEREDNHMRKKLTRSLAAFLSAMLALSPAAVYAQETEVVAVETEAEVEVAAETEAEKAVITIGGKEVSEYTANIGQAGNAVLSITDSSVTDKLSTTAESADKLVATAEFVVAGILKINAVSYGTTTVTLTSADETVSIPITVNVYCDAFALSDQTMQIGESIDLKPVFAKGYTFPEGNISYSSSDRSIVSTNGNKITAHKNGEVTITAKIDKDNNPGASDTVSATCKVKVTTLVSDIIVSDISVPCGKSTSLNPVVTPSDAANKSLTFTTVSNLFTLDKDGLVTAGDKPGKGAVIVQSTDGSNIVKTAYVTVTRAAESITTSQDIYEMYEGMSFNLNASILPDDATNTDLVYKSSDESIVTVNELGTVTGVAPGKAKITITEKTDEKVAKTVDVTVKGQIEGLSVEDKVYTAVEGDTFKIPFVVTVSGNDASFTDLLSCTGSTNLSDVAIHADPKEDGSFDTYVTAKGAAKGLGMIILTTKNPTYKNYTYIINVEVTEKEQQKETEKPADNKEEKPEDKPAEKPNVSIVQTGSIVETSSVTYVAVSNTELSVTKLTKEAASVTIPSTVTIEGKDYKVTQIADNAFAGNSKLTKVTIKSGITKIGKNAFKDCKKLRSVSIPSTVTEIGSNAFSGCSSLSKVTIPAKVKKIGSKAFYNCKKLKTVTIKSTVLKSVGSKAFTGTHKNLTVKVPKAKKNAYTKLLKKKIPAKGKVK